MINAPKYFTVNGWNLHLEGGRGMYYLYNVEAGQPFDYNKAKFVGRFKHGSPLACAKHFAKFLVANFTPAQYFAALEAPHACGFRTMAPAEVLKTKGYVHYFEAKHARELARAVARPYKF